KPDAVRRRHDGGAAVERSALDQQAAGDPQVQFPVEPVTKSGSAAGLRVAAVGKLLTLIALAGGSGSSRRIWLPFDMAPTCKPGVATLHVRHLLLHVE